MTRHTKYSWWSLINFYQVQLIFIYTDVTCTQQNYIVSQKISTALASNLQYM